MPAIERAYDGRIQMLKAIFGGGKNEDKGGKRPRTKVTVSTPMTPELFRALFGGKKK